MKISLHCEGQQFHQYQQNEQLYQLIEQKTDNFFLAKHTFVLCLLVINS